MDIDPPRALTPAPSQSGDRNIVSTEESSIDEGPLVGVAGTQRRSAVAGFG